MNQQYHTSFEDLLVKYMLQEASPEEIRTVEQWLAADPANRHYYAQVRLIWEKSLQTTLPDIPGEEETAWQTLREKLHEPARRQTPGQTPRHRILIHPLRWAAIAALFLLVALVPFLWWQHTGSTTWQTLATQNAIKTDTLPDGSTVTLNKHSSLQLPKKFKDRDIRLQGEAFFRVATDKTRPFHVRTNGITITVLGTSFNVSSDSARTTIRVESGRIDVRNNFGNIQLDSGETITLRDHDHQLQKHRDTIPLFRYYQPRDLICDYTPLWQAVEALKKSYGDSIVIADPKLRNLRISASFHNEKLSRILDVIALTLNLEVQHTDHGYILK